MRPHFESSMLSPDLGHYPKLKLVDHAVPAQYGLSRLAPFSIMPPQFDADALGRINLVVSAACHELGFVVDVYFGILSPEVNRQ